MINRKKCLIVCVVLLCAMSSAFCEEAFVVSGLDTISAKTLNLEDAVSSALEKSYSVKTAKNNLEKEINNSHVRSYLPTLSWTGSISESADLLHNADESLKYPTIRLSTGISWKLGSNDFLKKSTSSISLLNAELNLEREVNSVYSNVTSSYYNLISLKTQVNQASDSLKNAEANYNKTKAMYEGSKATKLSLLQAEITYNDSEISYENTVNSFNNSLVDFRILTGIEEDFVLPESPEVTGLNFDRLNSLAENNYDNTLSMKRAEADLKLAELNRANSIVENRVPSVSLNTNLTYNASKVRNNDFGTSLDLSASATVSIPLDSYLPWTQSNANVKNSALSVENAEISLENVKDSLRDNVRSSLNQINGYVVKVENLNMHLNLAEENYNETLAAYEKGYLSFNDLNTAKSNLDAARKNIANNNSGIITALCKYASLLDLNIGYVLDYLK